MERGSSLRIGSANAGDMLAQAMAGQFANPLAAGFATLASTHNVRMVEVAVGTK
jgi:predicted NBD/HSP70 family sugar kinase